MLTFRTVGGAVVAASAAALAAAFFAQYVAGLEPCPLCVYQRYPYAATIVLGALALATPGRWPALFVGLAGIVFAFGGGIAFYHVGVEVGLFEGTAACLGGGGEAAATVDELREQLLGTPPAPRCDEVAWSLFGVSIAGFNLMYAAVLATASLGVAATLAKRPRR